MATLDPPGYADVLAQFYPTKGYWEVGSDYSDLNWVDDIPIPQEELDALFLPTYQDMIKSAITNQIVAWIAQGYTYLGTMYDATPPTYQNMEGTMLVILSGGALLPDFIWWDAANVAHPMNAATFSIFYNAFTSWYNANYMIGYKKKLEVDALTTMDECAAYDPAVGWLSSDDDVVAWYASQDIPLLNLRRVISTIAFRKRFTDDELAAITLGAATAIASSDATQQIALDNLNASPFVNLDDTTVIDLVNSFVTNGFITSSRVTDILADSTDAEYPVRAIFTFGIPTLQ